MRTCVRGTCAPTCVLTHIPAAAGLQGTALAGAAEAEGEIAILG